MEHGLVQKLLEKYDTFDEVNDALMQFYADVDNLAQQSSDEEEESKDEEVKFDPAMAVQQPETVDDLTDELLMWEFSVFQETRLQ